MGKYDLAIQVLSDRLEEATEQLESDKAKQLAISIIVQDGEEEIESIKESIAVLQKGNSSGKSKT